MELPKLLRWAFIAVSLGVILLTVSLYMSTPIPILSTFGPGAGLLALGVALALLSTIRSVKKH